MLGAFIATQSHEALCSVCMVTDSAVVKKQAALSVGCAEGSDMSWKLEDCAEGARGARGNLYKCDVA